MQVQPPNKCSPTPSLTIPATAHSIYCILPSRDCEVTPGFVSADALVTRTKDAFCCFWGTFHPELLLWSSERKINACPSPCWESPGRRCPWKYVSPRKRTANSPVIFPGSCHYTISTVGFSSPHHHYNGMMKISGGQSQAPVK